jgi:hypothetical protein
VTSIEGALHDGSSLLRRSGAVPQTAFLYANFGKGPLEAAAIQTGRKRPGEKVKRESRLRLPTRAVPLDVACWGQQDLLEEP